MVLVQAAKYMFPPTLLVEPNTHDVLSSLSNQLKHGAKVDLGSSYPFIVFSCITPGCEQWCTVSR